LNFKVIRQLRRTQ